MKGRVFHIFVLVAISAIFLLPVLVRANSTPVPVLNINYQVEINTAITFDASDTFDIDSDDLLFIWDFGTGEQVEGQIVSHTYNVVGIFSVYLTVIDGTNASLVSFIIEVVSNQEITPNFGVGAVVNYSTAIVFNELMPNPAGSDDFEWIELFNSSNTVIDLAGWALRDASGKKYFINHDDFINTTIVAYDYFIIPRAVSGLSLNNTGETLELLNPDLDLIDATEYTESAGNDMAWALDNFGQWQWTVQATKGQKNIIQQFTTNEVVNINTNTSVVNNSADDLIIEATTTLVYATSGDIFISELLPAPAGDDREYEFIEIYNNSSTTVDLANWKLFDDRTDYIFSHININPTGYLLLERSETDITLNNTGDSISLADPTGNIIDSVEYSKAFSNQSYNRILDEVDAWVWSDNITPAEAYIAPETVVLGFSTSTNVSISDSEFFVSSISDIFDKNKDDQVVVQGSVTALPGEIDERIIYVADVSGGMQIYMHNPDWPELNYGDIVEITGTLSQAYGEYRIKIKNKTDIYILGSTNELDPVSICTDGFFDIGDKVILQGKIIKITKPYVNIESDCDDEVPTLKLSQDLLSGLKVNDIIKAVGIVRIRNDSVFIHGLTVEILPTDNPVTNSIDFVATENEEKNIIIKNSKIPMFSSWRLRLYVIILIIITGVSFIFYKKRKKFNN